MRHIKSIGIIIFYLVLDFISLYGQDRITGAHFVTRSEVIAQHGMAATSHPLATQVAFDSLKEGGSGIDAAIAANAILGLMEPTGCGIGGDLFAIVWDPSQKTLFGYNGSGRSPKSLTLEYFHEQGYTSIPAHGPLPVSVPGAVDGWSALHGRWGKLKWSRLFDAAIAYAQDGFPVTELISYYLNLSGKTLSKYPGFKEVYMPTGHMPAKGDIFKNPALARTYRRIANEGPDVFYKGEIAHAISSYMTQQGGFLSYDDLATHTGEWVKPVSTNYRGYDVWELPPNGQGIAALQILNILEQYDIRAMGFGSVDYIHLFTEAKKLAFADRAKYYADMDFVNIPVDKLISKAYAKERATYINMARAAKSTEPGILNTPETIYLTVADAQGMMVSLIQSNYRGMGSGMTPPDLGFVLQDRGELFSLDSTHYNVFAPGKRPFHTIIPCFITKDGQPWVSFGVMGGGMQPQGHAQIVANLIDFDMHLQEAGDAPRILHEGSSEPTGEIMKDGGTLYLETGLAPEVYRELAKRGHKIGYNVGGYGGYQAIQWNAIQQVYFGASESRKDGQAAGY